MSEAINTSELEILQRKIDNAKKRREKLRAEIERNDSEENRRKMARLEEKIERDSDTLHLTMIAQSGESFNSLAKMLPTIIAAQDEEELIELGDKSFAVDIFEKMRFFRNRFFDSTMMLSKNETVVAFLKHIDETITAGEKQLNEKRRQAAENFPELARKHRPPDFEMPAEYNEVLQEIMRFAEKREQLARDVKLAHPNKRQILIKGIAELDKAIDEAEQKMADRYEKYQTNRRYIEGLRKLVASGSSTERYQLREYMKANPGKIAGLEYVFSEYFPEEEDE